MASSEVVIGIDCGKAWLDAAVLPGPGRIRVANDEAGFGRLSAWAAEHGVARIGMEASGGYERAVRNHLTAAGMVAQVFDPGRVRHFAKAKGRRAKTDPIDAGVIAEFTAFFPDTASVGIDPAREDLAALVGARSLLVEKRADLIKAAALTTPAATVALTRAVKQMTEVITELTAQIDQRVAEAPDLAATVEVLQSVPGIGGITAATLAARLPELGHTSGARIAALVGVAPFANDSGGHLGQRHIFGGRADVRKALYMATLSATRAKGVISEFYKHLRDNGKKPKVALVACMRKLIVRLNAMLASGQTWQDQPA